MRPQSPKSYKDSTKRTTGQFLSRTLMQKYSITYSQTESKNASKRSSTMVKYTSSQRSRDMVQHIKKICQCNPPYNKLKEKNPYDHLIICWKSLWQNRTPLYDKSFGYSRDTRDLPKHNKGNLQQTYSWHKIKWRETQSKFNKIMNKIRLATLSISIQHST